jgi:catechol 2,3-dioxygenase
MYQTKMGHVLLNVYDLDRIIDFYTRFLNFRLVERVEDYRAFLSGSDAHHDIAFEKVELNVPHSPPDNAGLNHIAFEVPNKNSFARAFETLTQAGVHVTTSDNLISWSIYFDDPDGNLIEIYCDTRSEPDGQPLWRGIRKPLEPDRILAALEETDKG